VRKDRLVVGLPCIAFAAWTLLSSMTTDPAIAIGVLGLIAVSIARESLPVLIHCPVVNYEMEAASFLPRAQQACRARSSGLPLEPSGSPINVPIRLKIRSITSLTLPPPPCE
jgi:hypothetical protein